MSLVITLVKFNATASDERRWKQTARFMKSESSESSTADYALRDSRNLMTFFYCFFHFQVILILIMIKVDDDDDDDAWDLFSFFSAFVLRT